MKQVQEFIAKLSPQEKKIAYMAAIFFLLMLLDRLFFGPVMSQLSQFDDEIKEEESIAKRDLRLLAYQDRILKEDKEFSLYYGTKLKTEEEIIAAFLKKVEILATQAGVNLIKVSPADTVQQKGYIEYFANLDCYGPLENFTKFMHAIDTSQDMLRVTKFSITPKKGSEKDVQGNMMVVKVIINFSEKENVTKMTALGFAGGSAKVSAPKVEPEAIPDDARILNPVVAHTRHLIKFGIGILVIVVVVCFGFLLKVRR